MPSSAQSEKSTPFSGVRKKSTSWNPVRCGLSPATSASASTARRSWQFSMRHFFHRDCVKLAQRKALSPRVQPRHRLAVNRPPSPLQSRTTVSVQTVPPKRQLEKSQPLHSTQSKTAPEKSQFWNRHRCRHTRRNSSPDKSAPARHSPSTVTSSTSRSSPRMRLTREDFPTFGLPMTATLMTSSSSRSSSSGGKYWMQASRRSPVPCPWTAETGMGSPRPRL